MALVLYEASFWYDVMDVSDGGGSDMISPSHVFREVERQEMALERELNPWEAQPSRARAPAGKPTFVKLGQVTEDVPQNGLLEWSRDGEPRSQALVRGEKFRCPLLTGDPDLELTVLGVEESVQRGRSSVYTYVLVLGDEAGREYRLPLDRKDDRVRLFTGEELPCDEWPVSSID